MRPYIAAPAKHPHFDVDYYAEDRYEKMLEAKAVVESFNAAGDKDSARLNIARGVLWKRANAVLADIERQAYD